MTASLVAASSPSPPSSSSSSLSSSLLSSSLFVLVFPFLLSFMLFSVCLLLLFVPLRLSRHDLLSRTAVQCLSFVLSLCGAVLITSTCVWLGPHAYTVAWQFLWPALPQPDLSAPPPTASLSSFLSTHFPPPASSPLSSFLYHHIPSLLLLFGLLFVFVSHRLIVFGFTQYQRHTRLKRARELDQQDFMQQQLLQQEQRQYQQQQQQRQHTQQQQQQQQRRTAGSSYVVYSEHGRRMEEEDEAVRYDEDDEASSPLFHSSALARSGSHQSPSYGATLSPASSFMYHAGASSVVSHVDMDRYGERREWTARCIMCYDICRDEKGLAYHMAGCDHQPFAWLSLSNRALQSLRGPRFNNSRSLLSSASSSFSSLSTSSSTSLTVTASFVAHLLPLLIVCMSCASSFVPNAFTSDDLTATPHLVMLDAVAYGYPFLSYLIFSCLCFALTLRTTRSSPAAVALWSAIFSVCVTITFVITSLFLTPSLHDPLIYQRIRADSLNSNSNSNNGDDSDAVFSSPSVFALGCVTWEVVCKCLACGIYLYTGLVELWIEEWERREASACKLLGAVTGVATVLAFDIFLR